MLGGMACMSFVMFQVLPAGVHAYNAAATVHQRLMP